LPHVNM